jgi:hypothetical protein
MSSIVNNPVPLGKVTVDAAGTPVPLIDNFAGNPDYESMTSNKIDIQCPIDSPGRIYLGYEGMDKSTGVKVLREIMPGGSFGITDPAAANCFDVFSFYVDTDVNGGYCYASAHIR